MRLANRVGVRLGAKLVDTKEPVDVKKLVERKKLMVIYHKYQYNTKSTLIFDKIKTSNNQK